MLLLAGCGGAEEAPATSGTRRPSSASAEKSRTQALNDFTSATASFGGRPSLLDRGERLNACQIDATVFSRAVPDKADFRLVVSRLQKRGWKFPGPEGVKTAGKEVTTDLTSGGWRGFMGVGPLPEKVKAQAAPYTGGISFSASRTCDPA
ncbi:hypothetical protein OG985_32595 [Streptomyces sp. NBC_00289]|uniref:hypothetical protein n=1 Tax=Streptomyces sp. NBC_00289 TaxID=2975703 RepID=UPI00324F69E7